MSYNDIMYSEILSHYSYNQFFLILTLLASFIGASVHGFLSFYYCSSKEKTLFLWVPYLLLLLVSVQIETSYIISQASSYIVLFRILAIFLFVVLLYFYVLKRTLFAFISIILVLTIFFLSFITHYIPLYLTAFFLVLLIKISKPKPLDVIIKKYASVVLTELKEAVVIISIKKEILLINENMVRLLGLKGNDLITVKKMESHKFLSDSEINILIKNKKSGHFVKPLGNIQLYINYTFMPGKGLIFTASDITQSIELQKEIQLNILELEKLNAKLQNYSEKTERLRISEERSQLIKYIQGLIKSGMQELQSNLEKIKEKPPESYDIILDECRSLLEEIRLVAKEWRIIQGD